MTSLVANNVFSTDSPATIYVTDSVDGYASTLGTATVVNSANRAWTISLLGAFTPQTSPVTFRMYVVGIGWGRYGYDIGTNAFVVNGTVAPLVTEIDWNGTGSNSAWGTGSNWNSGSVPAATASPHFGLTGFNGTVDTGASPRTVAGLFFASAVSTTISGSSALILDNGASDAAVSVAGTHVISAPVTLNSNMSISMTSTGQLTFSGGIGEGSPGKGSTLLSGGTFILGGTNTYTGNTAVSGGNLNITGTLGNSAVTVSGTGTVSLQNAGAISQNTVTVAGGTLNQTVANSLGGTAALSVTSGTANLNLANNYSGATTISGTGNLVVTNSSGSATGTSLVDIQSGGTLSGSGSIGNAVTVDASGHIAPHLTASGTANLTFNGGLTVNTNSNLDFNLLPGAVSDKITVSSLTEAGTEKLNVSFPSGLAAGTY
ncbi:MAG: hypothetical protein WCI73_02730 [Phycisphaerae bacterium]